MYMYMYVHTHTHTHTHTQVSQTPNRTLLLSLFHPHPPPPPPPPHIFTVSRVTYSTTDCSLFPCTQTNPGGPLGGRGPVLCARGRRRDRGKVCRLADISGQSSTWQVKFSWPSEVVWCACSREHHLVWHTTLYDGTANFLSLMLTCGQKPETAVQGLHIFLLALRTFFMYVKRMTL